jgi:methyl-accepting chemotaxis protein
MVEESTATSRSLSAETSELTKLIGQFQVGGGNDDAALRRDLQKAAPHAFSPDRSRSSPAPQSARPRGAAIAGAR